MVTIWLDAQLSPGLAAWINRSFEWIEAHSVRTLNLRDAEDEVIFRAAREANAVVMTKDADFLRMLDETPTIWAIVLRLLSEDVTDVYDDMRALVH